MLKILSLVVLLLLCSFTFCNDGSEGEQQVKPNSNIAWSPWKTTYSLQPIFNMHLLGEYRDGKAFLAPMFSDNKRLREVIKGNYGRYGILKPFLKMECRVGE